MEAIETIQIDGATINIYPDEDTVDPRKDFDHMGTMVCWHGRYRLGDKNPFRTPDDFNDYRKANKLPVCLPLYLMDHSGLSMSTGSFRDQWDSGQVGWIYLTREKLLSEYSVKRATKAAIEKATKYLQGEVEEYDQYLTGQVYGYVIRYVDSDEEDSCWGFYGLDCVKAEALSEAQVGVAFHRQQDQNAQRENAI